MKIQVMSDLHREFYRGGSAPQINKEADYLVLAGDTHTNPTKFAVFLNKIADEFNGQIICIPGNHEYYKNRFPDVLRKYRDEVSKVDNAKRINLLNKQYLIPTDSDVAFLCATMWSDYNGGLDMLSAQISMNDYLFIKKHSGRKAKPYDFLIDHKETISFFDESITTPLANKKVIMVTHHAPSYKSVPAMFKGDGLNGAYVSSLEWFIEKHEPLVWIHGHTHSFFDYQLGPTRIVCNPFGYPHENNYKENYIIEV